MVATGLGETTARAAEGRAALTAGRATTAERETKLVAMVAAGGQVGELLRVSLLTLAGARVVWRSRRSGGAWRGMRWGTSPNARGIPQVGGMMASPAAAACVVPSAAPWENPTLLAVNKRATHVPLRSHHTKASAAAWFRPGGPAREYQGGVQLLSGKPWDFKLYPSPAAVPHQFWREDAPNNGHAQHKASTANGGHALASGVPWTQVRVRAALRHSRAPRLLRAAAAAGPPLAHSRLRRHRDHQSASAVPWHTHRRNRLVLLQPATSACCSPCARCCAGATLTGTVRRSPCRRAGRWRGTARPSTPTSSTPSRWTRRACRRTTTRRAATARALPRPPPPAPTAPRAPSSRSRAPTACCSAGSTTPSWACPRTAACRPSLR